MAEEHMKNKILFAIKNGSFVYKVKQKLHSIFPLYWISDKNIQFRNNVSRSYRKFYKKYKYIINHDEADSSLSHDVSNKVWICWFQGYDQAPELVKTAISSVRRNMPDKEIIILTDDNISQYTRFPKTIIEKRKQGKISAAHFSDLLRVELLCTYGGMWIDATVLCTSNNIPEYINHAPLFVYKSVDLTGQDIQPTVCSSWFISAKSNNNILLLTRKLLWQYWEDHNVLHNYFLFHIFMAMAARKYDEEWRNIPLFNNVSPHILQKELLNTYTAERWEQIKSMSIFHKLNHHIDFSQKENTFYRHIVKEFLSEID